MANFLKKLLKAYGPDRIIATGQFTTAGTGQPTAFNLNGIVSITRTAVGTFQVTLLDAAKEYHVTLGQQCTPALSDNRVVIGTINLTQKTILLSVAAAGAAADTTGITIYVTVSVRAGN